jgi:BlaI family penicillinase repressor
VFFPVAGKNICATAEKIRGYGQGNRLNGIPDFKTGMAEKVELIGILISKVPLFNRKIFPVIISQNIYFIPIRFISNGNIKANNFIIILGIDKFCKIWYNDENVKEGIPMELTKSELEIMDVLWDADMPLSRSDLLERSEEKSWKDSSVHILLNGLLQKEAIREAGFVKRSKTYGRTFLPNLSREEYFATTIFCHRHKPEIKGLFTALLERPEITKEDLDYIQSLVTRKQSHL